MEDAQRKSGHLALVHPRTANKCLVDAVAVDVVVRPGAPVNRGPGGGSLRVEGARRGVVLVRVDGNSRVALGLEVSAPRLVSLEPVATEAGVVPAQQQKIRLLCCLFSDIDQYEPSEVFCSRFPSPFTLWANWSHSMKI